MDPFQTLLTSLLAQIVALVALHLKNRDQDATVKELRETLKTLTAKVDKCEEDRLNLYRRLDTARQ